MDAPNPYPLPKNFRGTPLLYIPLYHPDWQSFKENRLVVVAYERDIYIVRVIVRWGWQIKGEQFKFSKPLVFEFAPDDPPNHVAENLRSLCFKALCPSISHDGYLVSPYRPCLTDETPRIFEEFFISIRKEYGADKENKLTATSLTIQEWLALRTKADRIILSVQDWLKQYHPELSCLPDWNIPLAMRI